MDPTTPSKREILKISIDFGTTYSKVAYAVFDHAKACEDILQGKLNIGEPENIMFGRDGHQVKSELAWSGRWYWGDEVDDLIRKRKVPESSRFDVFKLVLDDPRDSDGAYARLNAQISRLELPSEAGVTDAQDLIRVYLQCLVEHCRVKLGDKPQGNLFDLYSVETIINVPAMWVRQTNQQVVRIAALAGIPNVEIVSEPEAVAAFFQFSDSKRFATRFYEPFMIVDHGGGTVNVIMYSAAEGVISQAFRGVGGAYGSSKLNKYCGELFKDRAVLDKELIVAGYMAGRGYTTTDGVWEDIITAVERGFEIPKRTFTGDDSVYVDVRGIQRLPQLGIEVGQIVFPHAQVANEVFARVINPIVTLIKWELKQFKSTYAAKSSEIQRIFYVGGASANAYITSQLKQHFPFLEVPYENRYIVLVSIGAIYRSIQRHAYRERTMEYSLGFAWDEEYDRSVHGDCATEYDIHENYQIVKKCAMWLFRLNQNVVPGTKSRPFDGWQTLYIDRDYTRIREWVYSSRTETKDHLPVKGSRSIKKEGYIQFDIGREDIQDFVGVVGPMVDGKERWMRIDVRWQITYRGPDRSMMYEVLIPRRGVAASETDWENPICHEAELMTDVFDTTKVRPQIIPRVRPSTSKRPSIRPRRQVQDAADLDLEGSDTTSYESESQMRQVAPVASMLSSSQAAAPQPKRKARATTSRRNRRQLTINSTPSPDESEFDDGDSVSSVHDVENLWYNGPARSASKRRRNMGLRAPSFKRFFEPEASDVENTVI